MNRGIFLKRAGGLTAVILAALLLFLRGTPGGQGHGAGETPSVRDLLSNDGQIVAAIRHGLRNHARAITVTFSSGLDLSGELPAVAGEWVEEALSETDDPAEGDYIRYQYGGYRVSCRRTAEETPEIPEGPETGTAELRKGGGKNAATPYAYTVEIIPSYYLYLSQEERASEKCAEVMERFGFTAATPAPEKIRTIYDYVCGRVGYDRVHRKNPYYHLKSTAYAALIQGTATCQGYAVTLYRLLRTAGIPCRIVTGTAYGSAADFSRNGTAGEYHAWNICELDGLWYNLDATWDAGQDSYTYFLRGEAGFTDHVRDPAFSTPAFLQQYPMAAADYTAS